MLSFSIVATQSLPQGMRKERETPFGKVFPSRAFFIRLCSIFILTHFNKHCNRLLELAHKILKYVKYHIAKNYERMFSYMKAMESQIKKSVPSILLIGIGGYGVLYVDEILEDVNQGLCKLAGVVDPAKVTRVALENAASVAGMFLTTECVIADKVEENPMPMAPMGGGMGGMM